MPTVTYNNENFTCTTALKGADYIHLLDAETGHVTYGVGVSSNITRASVRAIFSAMNRLGLGE